MRGVQVSACGIRRREEEKEEFTSEEEALIGLVRY